MTRVPYEHGACDKPLIGETIGHNLERTVARIADGEALVSCHQGVRYSYAEFNEAVDRLASGMLAGGLCKDDRVGVWSTNCAEWALVQYATAKLGVILVNLNPAYRLSELEYALGQSGCRWVMAIRETRGSDFVEMIEQVRPVMGNLGATSNGSCIVYPAEAFDPEKTLEACHRERCTSLYGVPRSGRESPP